MGSRTALALFLLGGLLVLASCVGPLQSVHQVRYDPNGATSGSAPEDTHAWVPGAEAPILGNTGSLVNGDLVFAGWNTEPDGTGTAYPEGSHLLVEGHSVTLYAQWKIRSPSTDLQINEVVGSWGLGTPVAIELWNPTAKAVDLSRYQLRTHGHSNDGNATDVGLVTFDLPALSVPAKGYSVVRSHIYDDFESGGATVFLEKAGSSPTVVPWFSGTTDSLELLKDGATVDFVRWGGSDEVSATGSFGFQGQAPVFPLDGQSISRDVGGQFTPSPSDWTVHLWNTLGGPNDVTNDTDTDGDGLPDSAESSGGSLAGLPLNDWGARPDRVDLFVHIDYMKKAGTPPTVIPQRAALQKVVDRFAVHNIAVHFDVGNLFSSVFSPADFNLDNRSHAVKWSDSVSIGPQANKANVNKLKASSMPLAKNRAFFYLLFGNSQDYGADQVAGRGGSGGLAYVWGNVSLVTLGDWYDYGLTNVPEIANVQAATILHELGHNLGLRHGGWEDANDKPNYLSIMNYMYSYAGIPNPGNEDGRYYAQYNDVHNTNIYSTLADPTSWSQDGSASSGYRIDLSDGSSSDLNQAVIVESAGIGRSGSAPIDFNNNLSTNDVTGINILELLNPGAFRDPDTGNLTTWPADHILKDYDDWGHLNAVFQHSYSGTSAGPWRNLSGLPRSLPRSMGELLAHPSTELSGDSGLRRR